MKPARVLGFPNHLGGVPGATQEMSRLLGTSLRQLDNTITVAVGQDDRVQVKHALLALKQRIDYVVPALDVYDDAEPHGNGLPPLLITADDDASVALRQSATAG